MKENVEFMTNYLGVFVCLSVKTLSSSNQIAKMRTSDWAEEAHAFFHAYHDGIVSGSLDRSLFHLDVLDDDKESDNNNNSISGSRSLLRAMQTNPLLRGVDLSDWQKEENPFILLEQTRGWQPLLRRLPLVPDHRLLTLIRKDLRKPLSDASNHTLVSRQQWTVMEWLRWNQGLYNHQQETIQVLAKQPDDATLHKTLEETYLEIVSQSSLPNAGRCVVYRGSQPTVPGQVLWRASPWSVAPYDVEPNSTRTACFHCGRDLSSSSSSEGGGGGGQSMVRDLTLQCRTCRIWSYCSIGCKHKGERFHQLECPHLVKLIQNCPEGLPPFKALLVYRAILKEGWREALLDLQDHWQDHAQHNPEYLQQATTMSRWMVENNLVDNTTTTTTSATVEELVRLFLIININAIGLGRGAAVGLFPGLPSMLNHSCNETVTHSWEGDKEEEERQRLVFRAVETIHPGEECHISYVSNLQDATPERTQPLQQYKFFACQCPRCRSPDEEGRSEAIREWKDCLHRLESNNGYVVPIYRRLVELCDVLFPQYFVTKGWAMEECAHSLRQDTRCHKESIDLLLQARAQYEICRGEESELVRRIDRTLHEWTITPDTVQPEHNHHHDDDDNNNIHEEEEDDDADLVLVSGWSSTTLLEVKTYDPQEDDLPGLAGRIQRHWDDATVVQWNEGYRLYDLGFGIQTLILSCKIQESIKTKEVVAEETAEMFDDTIQHVDIIS